MKNLSRRRFIAMGSVGLATIPVSSMLSTAVADDLPMVDPESAQAKALQYVTATATEGQMCSNCVLYQGDADTPAAACGVFPGSSVGKDAWCAAWSPKG